MDSAECGCQTPKERLRGTGVGGFLRADFRACPSFLSSPLVKNCPSLVVCLEWKMSCFWSQVLAAESCPSCVYNPRQHPSWGFPLRTPLTCAPFIYPNDTLSPINTSLPPRSFILFLSFMLYFVSLCSTGCPGNTLCRPGWPRTH